MNSYYATKEVVKLVEASDDIAQQLISLREHAYRRGVRRYIDDLVRANILRDDEDSKYILYVIVKYFYGLDVKKVKEPAPTLPNISSKDYNQEEIAKLLSSRSNAVEQCKLLREHKNSRNVQNYMETVEEYCAFNAMIGELPLKYQQYCIDKYYYGLDVPRVKPTHIKLRAYIKTKPEREEIKDIVPLENVKVGEQVKLLTGPFKDLIGTITNIKEDNTLTLLMAIDGQEFETEVVNNQADIIRIRDNNEL